MLFVRKISEMKLSRRAAKSFNFDAMKSVKNTILIAPLDWGLGHATRCIPVIRELQRQNIRFIIGGSGARLTILKKYFPDAAYETLPELKVRYPSGSAMALKLFFQLPHLLTSVYLEHRELKKLIEKYGITHVISDNRYGLWNKKIKSAFICHQVKIISPKKLKFFEPFINFIHRKLIEKHTVLWVPDCNKSDRITLAFSTTEKLKIPITYTGMLSRFDNTLTKHVPSIYENIALLSGPEPQRSILEKKLVDYFNRYELPSLIVRGLPGRNKKSEGVVDYRDDITDSELTKILSSDTVLFCRSGYSTIMDLAKLGHCKVIFIPTPGQTEQEILGTVLQKKYNYTVLSQSDWFNFIDAKEGMPITDGHEAKALSQAIENFNESIQP